MTSNWVEEDGFLEFLVIAIECFFGESGLAAILPQTPMLRSGPVLRDPEGPAARRLRPTMSQLEWHTESRWHSHLSFLLETGIQAWRMRARQVQVGQFVAVRGILVPKVPKCCFYLLQSGT